MLGYPPASYSSFPILEVMASSQYHLKQVGYLAATQSFNQDTDVLILATNLVQKVSLCLRRFNPLSLLTSVPTFWLCGDRIYTQRIRSKSPLP